MYNVGLFLNFSPTTCPFLFPLCSFSLFSKFASLCFVLETSHVWSFWLAHWYSRRDTKCWLEPLWGQEWGRGVLTEQWGMSLFCSGISLSVSRGLYLERLFAQRGSLHVPAWWYQTDGYQTGNSSSGGFNWESLLPLLQEVSLLQCGVLPPVEFSWVDLLFSFPCFPLRSQVSPEQQQ